MGFSKNSQSSTTSNQAFPFLQNALGGVVSNVGSAAGGLSSLLGGDALGLHKFQDATGFGSQLQYGLRGVSSSGAAAGLLNSGSTQKALMNYGNMLENQSSQNYIQNLLGLGNLGLGAAGTIAGAGQTSSSKGSGKGLQFKV